MDHGEHGAAAAVVATLMIFGGERQGDGDFHRVLVSSLGDMLCRCSTDEA